VVLDRDGDVCNSLYPAIDLQPPVFHQGDPQGFDPKGFCVVFLNIFHFFLTLSLPLPLQFGAFFLLTIVFSWLWSNFVFMGVMATIGRPKLKEASASGAVHPSSPQEAGRDLPTDK
jgi:hypothetical protein